MAEIKTFTLPAGCVVSRSGIPFRLMCATQIECHPDNWPLIRDGFVPSVGGQALDRSQSFADAGMPSVAQLCGVSATTSNESLESSTGTNNSRI